MGLPSGELDLPLVIQDRSFDRDNQLVYVADTMNGFFGDQVLVNGQSPAPLESAGPAVPAAPAERLQCPHLQTGLE